MMVAIETKNRSMSQNLEQGATWSGDAAFGNQPSRDEILAALNRQSQSNQINLGPQLGVDGFRNSDRKYFNLGQSGGSQLQDRGFDPLSEKGSDPFSEAYNFRNSDKKYFHLGESAPEGAREKTSFIGRDKGSSSEDLGFRSRGSVDLSPDMIQDLIEQLRPQFIGLDKTIPSFPTKGDQFPGSHGCRPPTGGAIYFPNGYSPGGEVSLPNGGPVIQIFINIVPTQENRGGALPFEKQPDRKLDLPPNFLQKLQDPNRIEVDLSKYHRPYRDALSPNEMVFASKDGGSDLVIDSSRYEHSLLLSARSSKMVFVEKTQEDIMREIRKKIEC